MNNVKLCLFAHCYAQHIECIRHITTVRYIHLLILYLLSCYLYAVDASRPTCSRFRTITDN